MTETLTDYKSTVFLPRTAFPMRGELPKREPEILRRWTEMDLWARLRAAAKGRKPFVLHDGPPYANGNLHIGHALNKIHKDVINRAQQMAGKDADYIPGWDCHGLPIEWKVEEKYRAKKLDKDQVPVLEFRKECREYAQHWLDVQAAEFQRLGVAGDWANRYATMDFASEAAIAGEIGKFLLNGALYRGLRPVMWSPVEKTALAEAEVEYHDKKDTAIYVRFPAAAAEGAFAGCAIVIWTTTPWTIPGNRGLAAGHELEYAIVTVDEVAEGSLAVPGERLIVGTELLEAFAKEVGITAHSVGERFKGTALEGQHFQHPLAKADAGFDFTVPVMLGEFVTMEAGTGIVHMAPGHGEDDFALCKANGIKVPETVGDDGTYYPSVPLFAGLHVYKAAGPVCDKLTEMGNLVHRNEFLHSYPHSWRSKAPLIYRATAQWFIRMDGEDRIREQALAALDETKFVPEIGRNRIRSMVETRPDWCISRQRAWGVPIAIFVDKRTHEPLRDEGVVERVVEIFTQEGADAWYARPASDFLGLDRNPDDYEQIFDVVDVWFESGSTHAFVLEARGMSWPADVYLEGSDQHRGWFQSSLLEAVGTRGRAPFKAIVTDGFVLDEQGRKMSKSLGNVTAPQEVNDKYGADILRLWVLNSDISEDLRIGPEILKQQAELYRRLRNSLRWILGSLDGFSEAERVAPENFPDLEKFLLHRLWELNGKLRTAVEGHDWTGVYPAIHHFCTTDLSAFYFDIRKDSLYCDAPSSHTRKSCRSFLDILFRCLTTWLAPALPFTAEEAWMARYGAEASVHLDALEDAPEAWANDALAEGFAQIRALRGDVTGAIEKMRVEKQIGSSLQAQAVLADGARTFGDEAFWAEICITSAAAFGEENKAGIAPGQKCERCWKVLPEVGDNAKHPTLCRRCCEAVEEIA
ncbi:isoleucine--tRNA ligase [Acidocella aminolytica]|jgi:isoleucyl-tRNA synthetase|uniref:Isoleucine--tRNA ligase n=1 Tax=Acidocella aminolytica 101 = DSM 11237 TaxID=1120923 RepID=A0A0D6PDL1_9PROT|nr:isoleucine--tRNA ligase [Acidocella aminolytica]GAN79742.1 isoleucyl-tRNA synthetase [Acidocella aminolytica 101 = DSM 11237]GBQ38622.1 isoleucyl-tRNA synthetase [Acidocella aminolytica 101 = DSM 11237]SHE75684.1 Isoleucyl-tRNA synthetase [Acidocella aminolytica 101 = DSM 11237]